MGVEVGKVVGVLYLVVGRWYLVYKDVGINGRGLWFLVYRF